MKVNWKNLGIMIVVKIVIFAVIHTMFRSMKNPSLR